MYQFDERLFRSAIMNDKDIHALAYYMKDKDILETVDQTLINLLYAKLNDGDVAKSG